MSIASICDKMTTFKVEDVKKSSKRLPRKDESGVFLERCGSVKPEARSGLKHVPFEESGSWSPLNNAFISAVHTAFANHYPLVLSPDAIWLVISQGFANHVNANAESLRKSFVDHEGKKTIEIILDRGDFVKGSPKNPWGDVLDLFSEGIRRNVGDKTHDLLTPTFSTTGPVERAASQIVLMNCFKEYFLYQMVCICGIPEVTLEGTPEDWSLLRDKALSLGQFDLEWWTVELKPILDQFVEAASGKVDVEFWRRIYKLKEAYGTHSVNGWILDLFPYIGDGTRKNHCLGKWKTIPLKLDKEVKEVISFEIGEDELSTESFPPGVISAPFVWKIPGAGKEYKMKFFAGFMAATQNSKTLAIQPEIGWAVADEETEKKAADVRKSHDSRSFW